MSWHERPCCWDGCAELAHPQHRHPLCREHAMAIARAYFREVKLEQAGFADEDEARAAIARSIAAADAERAEAAARPAKQAVVYYVQLGGLIKIGYTSSLKQRLASLRALPDELLAIEPGGLETERRRHKQFATARIDKRENFHPTAELLAHIEQLNTNGPMPLTNSPATTLA